MHPLVKYWLEIGWIQRQRRNPEDPASPWIYYLENNGFLVRIPKWKDFFLMMNTYNFHYFIHNNGGCRVHDSEGNDAPVRPYDPWNDVTQVQINARFSKMFPGGGFYDQEYRVIGHFK